MGQLKTMNEKELEARVRDTPLTERLEKCKSLIGQMCSQDRPPKMSIPVQWDDEDFFISTTINDARELTAKYKAIEDAIRDYHYALDTRQHGAVAQDKAIKAIEGILSLPWRQGEELQRRKAAPLLDELEGKDASFIRCCR